MSFFEELKNVRDKQIMAIGMVFSALFPCLFLLREQNDLSGASNVVATYEVEGEPQYIELGSGDEFIADGETLSIDNLHTDSIDDADEMNIIGVRLTMSYTEVRRYQRGLPVPGAVNPRKIRLLEQPCMVSIIKRQR